MEDCNTLVADCVVISCCCECLILQLLVFFLLRLPYKLAQKTKKYAKKLRLRYTRKSKTKSISNSSTSSSICLENELGQASLRLTEIEVEGFSAMEEVEKVLGELSLKGEFVFGSFWGRERHFTGSSIPSAACVGDRRNSLAGLCTLS